MMIILFMVKFKCLSYYDSYIPPIIIIFCDHTISYVVSSLIKHILIKDHA